MNTNQKDGQGNKQTEQNSPSKQSGTPGTGGANTGSRSGQQGGADQQSDAGRQSQKDDASRQSQKDDASRQSGAGSKQAGVGSKQDTPTRK